MAVFLQNRLKGNDKVFPSGFGTPVGVALPDVYAGDAERYRLPGVPAAERHGLVRQGNEVTGPEQLFDVLRYSPAF